MALVDYAAAIAALDQTIGMWELCRDREEDGTFSYSCRIFGLGGISYVAGCASPLEAINKAFASDKIMESAKGANG